VPTETHDQLPDAFVVVSNVELRHLEYFLAVVEEGSFTRAAARLYMVQSSLSAALLNLERELGTELFIRGRRGSDLTDAGQALVEPARIALVSVEHAKEAVAEVNGLLRGTVRIAVLAVPPALDLIDMITGFHERHPGVRVQVIPTDAKSMVDMVADGEVDVAITPRSGRISKALQFQSLISSSLALLCPRGHRLAGACDVDPRDLADEWVIDLPASWRSRELFDQLMQQHHVGRQVRLEVTDWWFVLALVQRGVGLAYGPYGCVDSNIFDGVEFATIAGAPRWEIGIATRDDALRGAAGRAFLAAYLRQVGSSGERGSG
jgi:DNA-binding transcriptional LysR family regulator